MQKEIQKNAIGRVTGKSEQKRIYLPLKSNIPIGTYVLIVPLKFVFDNMEALEPLENVFEKE